MEFSTAWDLLQAESSHDQTVTSFCEQLDELLGGGFPLGKLTEVAGAAGIGKTQLCLQLSVDVQIPSAFGGVEGEAIFIDTEGSFNTKRLRQIAVAAVDHIQRTAVSEVAAASWSVDSIFNRIHHCRCEDHTHLMGITSLLEDFVRNKPKVKLVLIDSVAFLFRQEFDNFQQRNQLLNTVVLNLMKIAHQHRIAVVLTNQMTTKIDSDDVDSLAPALGDSWGHNCSSRIVLYTRLDGVRAAKIIKSSFRPEAEVAYAVTADGIRDV